MEVFMFNTQTLCGVFAPIVTPFDVDEEILMEDIASNIMFYNQTGLRGYMPLGSNGEFQGLTDDESLQVLNTVYKYKANNKIIVGGCGRESAYKTIELIKKTADCGLDLAFILPPHYFLSKMDDESLFRYYVQIADRSPIPIVIYNAPKFAGGLNLSPELIKQLSQHSNIVAMKNSSNTPNNIYIQATRGMDFCIIAGNIATFYSGLCEGAIGGVLSTASYLPEYCCYLYESFCSGDLEIAEKLHSLLNELSAATIGPLGIAGVKLGMELRGLMGGHVRLPLLDVTAGDRKKVESYFKKVGLC
jgi:4-hydroxy-2-oxoglutarate aldolase